MFDLEKDQTKTTLKQNLASNFVISHGYTYVLLKPGFGPEEVDAGMPHFLRKYAPANRLIGQKFTLFAADRYPP